MSSLPPSHRAARLGTTVFPTRVYDYGPINTPPFKPGGNNKKLGKSVVKGRLAGAPIFSLTLEERATCPRSCRHWLSCYGNNMHWAFRYRVDDKLLDAIGRQLNDLSKRHPTGYLVRLHALGDFPTVAYVELWRRWLEIHPALHVFGYTAHPIDSPIGAAIRRLSLKKWDRFAVRHSDGGGELGSTVSVLTEDTDIGDAILCPEQRGLVDSCASCALCWHTRRNIAFETH